MGLVSSKVVYEGSKNVVVQVNGFLPERPNPFTLFELTSFKDPPKALRVDSLVFSFQDKAGLLLYWGNDKDSQFILPVEGRSTLSFENMQSVHSGAVDRMYAVPYNAIKNEAFLLLLDLVRQ